MKVGDPITYFDDMAIKERDYYEGTVHMRVYRSGLVRSRVRKVGDKLFIPKLKGAPILALPAEGITWIRGHHTKRSTAGKALIAAYALSRSRAA